MLDSNGLLGTALIVLYILGYTNGWLLALGIVQVIFNNIGSYNLVSILRGKYGL